MNPLLITGAACLYFAIGIVAVAFALSERIIRSAPTLSTVLIVFWPVIIPLIVLGWFWELAARLAGMTDKKYTPGVR